MAHNIHSHATYNPRPRGTHSGALCAGLGHKRQLGEATVSGTPRENLEPRYYYAASTGLVLPGPALENAPTMYSKKPTTSSQLPST